MSRTVEFWYDLISPYSYAALARLEELPEDVTIQPRLLLLGAVLKHHDQIGPAEREPKRTFIYRQSVHLIASLGLPAKFPPRHPFNPLAADRLLAGANEGAGATLEQVRTAFSLIFGEGMAVDTEEGLVALARKLGMDPALASAPASKERLKKNTGEAIDSGVFGVPAFVPVEADGTKGPVFWGVDGMGLLKDWLSDPCLFNREPYAALDSIEVGIERREAS